MNIIKVLISFYLSRIRKQPHIKGLPIGLSIEPTTSCNLRCPQCPSGLRSFTRNTGMLDQKLFTKIIDDQSETLLFLTFYFQGEPYLHPAFLEMVSYAHKKNIFVSTSTNAHYLTEEIALATVKSGLDRLIISLDGNSQETYSKYRIGGKFITVLEGITSLIEAKKILKSKTPHIVIQNIVFSHNEHEISTLKQRFEGKDVELQFKTAQIYDYENGSDLIPVNKTFSRYEKDPTGGYQIKNNFFNHCWKMWHSSVVTWDGKVIPCCFDKDAQFRLGDLQNDSFSKVWQSDGYNNFRKQLLTNRKEIEICKNCSEGTKIYI